MAAIVVLFGLNDLEDNLDSLVLLADKAGESKEAEVDPNAYAVAVGGISIGAENVMPEYRGVVLAHVFGCDYHFDLRLCLQLLSSW